MNNVKKQGVRGEVFLTITAIIWGTSFVVQKVSLDYVGPFTFVALRLCWEHYFCFQLRCF
ncbi:MAG: EamA family transporter [Candidatus Syntrophopropionicum ammoniitolerans]